LQVTEHILKESGGTPFLSKDSAPSATATSSQQHQVSSQPTHTPTGKKPTQAKAVEAEKQKHPQQQHQCTEGTVANKSTDDNLPDRLSVRKRKPAATQHIDSDNEEVSPQTLKFVKSMTKIFKKEKTATPSTILEDIQARAIGDLLLDAARNNKVAKPTEVIRPKDKEVYVVKGGTVDIVRSMDKFFWRHNGKHQLPGIGTRLYYNGRLNVKSLVIDGFKKTIIHVEKQNTYVVHYKVPDTVDTNAPEASTSDKLPTQQTSTPLASQQHAIPEPRARGLSYSGTLRKLIPKSWADAAVRSVRRASTASAEATQPTLAGDNMSAPVTALPEAGDNLQPTAAIEQESEDGETDAENLQTDYEMPMTTDTEGNEEEDEDVQLPNVESMREAIKIPWDSKWKKFNKGEAKMVLAFVDEELINNPWETIISNPDNRELYIFDVSKMENWKEHLRKDTYRWKNFVRPSKVDPSISETYSYVKDRDGKYNSHFRKRILHFTNEKKVVIGYEGDKSIGTHLLHGNATKSTRPYIPVSNVILEKRVQALAGRKAKDVYEELINEPADPNVKLLTHPRSKEHVQAVQDRLQRPYNFLKDDLTACHRVGQIIPKYIRLESTLHDCFNYVLCHEEILEQYRKAIDIMPTDEPLVHHLDTTYEFNKKYLSVLSFRHPALADRRTKTTEPTIPLFSYIHQRKAKYDHDLAFWAARQAISDAVPRWEEKSKILVTDREFKSDNYMPNTKMVYCWNHLLKNLDYHARDKVKLSAEDASAAGQDLQGMLRSSSEANYIRRKREAFQNSSVWTPEMKKYFDDYLDNDIKSRAGRWYLETLNLPNAQQGLTNNPAESLNNVYANLRKDEPQKPLAKLVVDLHRLDTETARAMNMAFFSAGNYDVKQTYRQHCLPNNQMPNFLVQRSREVIDEIAEQVRQEEEEDAAYEAAARSDMEQTSQSESEAESITSAVAAAQHIPEIAALAQDCVERKRIDKMNIEGIVQYGVVGADGLTRVVNLASNLCTCKSLNPCYHWLAARVHAGVQNNYHIPPEFKISRTAAVRKGKRAHHGSKKALRIDTQHEALGSAKPRPFRQVRSKTKVQFNFEPLNLNLSDIVETSHLASVEDAPVENVASQTTGVPAIDELNTSVEQLALGNEPEEEDILSGQEDRSLTPREERRRQRVLTISGSDTEMDESVFEEMNRTLGFGPQVPFEGLLQVVDAPQHAVDVKVLSTAPLHPSVQVSYVGSPDVKMIDVQKKKRSKRKVKQATVKIEEVVADTSGIQQEDYQLPSLDVSASTTAEPEAEGTEGREDAGLIELREGRMEISSAFEEQIEREKEKEGKRTEVTKAGQATVQQKESDEEMEGTGQTITDIEKGRMVAAEEMMEVEKGIQQDDYQLPSLDVSASIIPDDRLIVDIAEENSGFSYKAPVIFHPPTSLPPPLPPSAEPEAEGTKGREDAGLIELREGRMEISSAPEEQIEREKEKEGKRTEVTEAGQATVQQKESDEEMEVPGETDAPIEKEKEGKEMEVTHQTTVGPENTKEIQIRKINLSCPLREENLRLVRDQDCNLFVHKGRILGDEFEEIEAFIAMRKGDKVVTIMREGDKFGKREEFYSAWSGAPVSNIWGRNKFADKVTVIPYYTNGDLKEAAKVVSEMKRFPQKSQKAKKMITLSDCYCAKPAQKDDVTIVCKDCLTNYHPACMGNPPNTVDWSCDKHMILTGGAKWCGGEGTNNTCSLDNHLTLFGELSCRDSQFWQLFNRDHPGDKAMYDTLESARHGDYGTAQLKWAGYLGKKNLDGSPGETVINHLGESCLFVKKGVCSYDKCPERHQTVVQPKDQMLFFEEEITTSFAKLVTDVTVEQCMKCNEIGIEDSKLTLGPLEPKDPAKPPAFLHLTDTSQGTFTNACKLPRTVTLGGYEYKHTMVVQYKSDKCAHFNALMNLDGQWLRYDGIDYSLKNDFFSMAKPRDFAHGSFRVDSLVYTINK